MRTYRTNNTAHCDTSIKPLFSGDSPPRPHLGGLIGLRTDTGRHEMAASRLRSNHLFRSYIFYRGVFIIYRSPEGTANLSDLSKPNRDSCGTLSKRTTLPRGYEDLWSVADQNPVSRLKLRSFPLLFFPNSSI